MRVSVALSFEDAAKLTQPPPTHMNLARTLIAADQQRRVRICEDWCDRRAGSEHAPGG